MDYRLTELPDIATIKMVEDLLKRNPETRSIPQRTLQDWFQSFPDVSGSKRERKFTRGTIATVLDKNQRSLTPDPDDATVQIKAQEQALYEYLNENSEYQASLQPSGSFNHKFPKKGLKILRRNLKQIEIDNLEQNFNRSNIYKIAGKVSPRTQKNLLLVLEQLTIEAYKRASQLNQTDSFDQLVSPKVESELHKKTTEFVLLKILETVSQSKIHLDSKKLQYDLGIKVSNELAGNTYYQLTNSEQNAFDRLTDFHNYFTKD